jgi:anti-anti-sigma regulatory factor
VSDQKQAGVHLRLRGRLGDDDVTALRQQIATCLASGVTDIRVHLDEQSDVDLPVLQVLQGAGDYLAKRGGRLSVLGAGPAVVKKMRIHGLERLVPPAPGSAAGTPPPAVTVSATPSLRSRPAGR